MHKIKHLIANNTIGSLLSSTLTYETGWPGDVEPPTSDYFTNKESGGNFLTIAFGHTADAVFHVLGGLQEASTLLTTRWPDTKLLHKDGSFDRMLTRETPDHVMLHGVLKNNAVPISMAMRSGKAFPDGPNLVWRIFGTEGEVRFTSAAMPNICTGGERLEVFDHEGGGVEVVHVEYAEEVRGLTPLARNTGMMYEGFVKGVGVEEGFVGFGEAVEWLGVIGKMERGSETRTWERMGD
jgi:predicted dehydrogenase